MPLVAYDKSALSPAQAQLVLKRLSLKLHKNDLGPPVVWNTYTNGLFAFFDQDSQRLVALVEASGQDAVRPGWWVDSAFRGKGYGNEVIDLLAALLKSRGVTSIGPIAITTHQQEYDVPSTKLAKRLRKHFAH